MSFVNKTIYRVLISLLFAVYSILLLKAFFSLNKLPLIIIGIVVFSLCYFIAGFAITNFSKKVSFTQTALLSAAIAVLLMVAAPGAVPGSEQPALGYVKVTAMGIKNDSAKATEVWITGIIDGGSATNIKTISASKEWEEKHNQLVSYKKQPATQEIEIRYPGTYRIDFIKHAWSGKVKIEDGKNTTIIDLYDNGQIDKYTYAGNSIIPATNYNANLYKYGFILISFLTLSIFWYICFVFAKAKNNYFQLLFPLTLFVFFLSDYFPFTYSGKLLAVATSIAAHYAVRKMSLKDYIKSFTVKEKAFFLLIMLYGSFAFIGHQLFLATYPVKQITNKIAYFILFSGWLAFVSIGFLCLTELVKSKIGAGNINTNGSRQNQSAIKLYLTFFGIMTACWLIYLIAFFPANMSTDSLDQWAQATGTIPLNNWHPVFHTLFNKLAITIYKSPASIALAQIIFMAGVFSGFFLFLYQKGIPAKWLKWAALLIGLIPANGIMSVTLWKDVPFTVALVWLTLVLAKIVTNDDYFKHKAAYAEVVIALATAGLFRHNGVPVYMLAVAGLLLYYFKLKKAGILVSISISTALVGGYYMYISKPSRVIPNPPAIKLVAPIHGIAAVNYYNGRLDKETIRELHKILPDSVWRSHYRPFSVDKYLFFTNSPFVERLSNLPTSKALQLYLNTLAKNPYLVIRDRLTGSEMVWNVTEANGSFNYRYHVKLDRNSWGFVSPPNFLKKVLEDLLDFTAKIADPFLWRAGIYNFLLLLLLLLLAKQRKWYLLLFIPVIATNFSLLLSMSDQHFRYIFYVPLIFGYMWLLYISNMAGKKVK